MQLDVVVEAARSLRAEGIQISQNRVLARVGGSKRDLVMLWPQLLQELGEPVPSTLQSPHEQWRDVTAARQAAHQRLGVLNSLATVQVLSEAEEAEQLRLERRLANLAPVIARLEKEVQQYQQRADIDAVMAAWEPLRAAKAATYQAFVDALVQLRGTFAGILAVHAEQEAVLRQLPRAAQEKLAFPDPQTLAQRVVGRMPRGYNLEFLLLAPLTLRALELEPILDVDPGVRQIPPHLLEPYRQED